MRLLALLLVLAPPSIARAGEARIAVASNFTAAAGALKANFEGATDHQIAFSFASTGQLFAQIRHGAPFDAYLAADQARPRRAVADGLAVDGSQFTYALGRLVLYSAQPRLPLGSETLADPALGRVAIANPATAPYGAASVAALRSLGLYDRLGGKLVLGANIVQAYQFAATANAEVGFVAASQLIDHDGGSRWVLPEALYPPIRQDAVLLTPGADNDAARAFLAFIRSTDGQAIIAAHGYGRAEP